MPAQVRFLLLWVSIQRPFDVHDLFKKLFVPNRFGWLRLASLMISLKLSSERLSTIIFSRNEKRRTKSSFSSNKILMTAVAFQSTYHFNFHFFFVFSYSDTLGKHHSLLSTLTCVTTRTLLRASNNTWKVIYWRVRTPTIVNDVTRKLTPWNVCVSRNYPKCWLYNSNASITTGKGICCCNYTQICSKFDLHKLSMDADSMALFFFFFFLNILQRK